ncbi:hypothetical protein ACSQ76_06915 [Roseovarius sp. B08]|uniref:hypothetical protein n=1 Tax=Roseovarius sp. B08 TaxID=3449223 RepID=UPI003EDBA70D
MRLTDQAPLQIASVQGRSTTVRTSSQGIHNILGVIGVVTVTAQTGQGDLDAGQRTALDEIRHAFRIR